jgi:lipopolysaccharide/colanic/teichoic acid biosynthesis glycosyltransferase
VLPMRCAGDFRSRPARLGFPAHISTPRLRVHDHGKWSLRALDFAVLLVAAPVILLVGGLIAVAVFLDSPGPIFYRAQRIGRHGRPFAMVKFRKMTRDAQGPNLTLAGDDRFTPIGRFLSKTRLDELPQVWNVLRGEMRLVGPRPEVATFVDEHREAYHEILTVTPGLTGPSQLAHLNEAELLAAHDDPVAAYARVLMPAKIALDTDYVRHRSLRVDLWLLLRTTVFPVRQLGMPLDPRRWRNGAAWLALGAAVSLAVVFIGSSTQ